MSGTVWITLMVTIVAAAMAFVTGTGELHPTLPSVASHLATYCIRLAQPFATDVSLARIRLYRQQSTYCCPSWR